MAIRFLADLQDLPQPTWMWEGYLAPQNVTLLSAHPKAGKTTFTFHLLRAIWSGHEFLGQATHPCPVLYVSEEADTLIAARAGQLGFSQMWPIGFVTAEPGRTWRGTIAYIEHYLTMFAEPLVIIDTLSRHWMVENENEASAVESALRPLLDLVRNSRAAVLCIHHLRKSGGPEGLGARGSTALGANFDILLELSRMSPYDTTPRRRLEALSRYELTPPSRTLQLTAGGYEVIPEDEDGSERTILNLLARTEAVTAEQVAEELGISDRYAREILARLASRGLAARAGTGSKVSPYRYSVAPVRHPE